MKLSKRVPEQESLYFFLMNFISLRCDNPGMGDSSSYRVPDATDYMLSDSGAGSGYFFGCSSAPPEDSALRFYCHRACLILSEGLTARETALSLGFPDYNLFCRQFRFYTGLYPDEYREWIRRRKDTQH